jgi:hypothetical protein
MHQAYGRKLDFGIPWCGRLAILRFDASLAGGWRRAESESFPLPFPRHTFVAVSLTGSTDLAIHIINIASDFLLVAYDAGFDCATSSAAFVFRHLP